MYNKKEEKFCYLKENNDFLRITFLKITKNEQQQIKKIVAN